jgi:hypothetical protein
MRTIIHLCVAAGLRLSGTGPAKFVLDDVKDFDPAKPDSFATYNVPPSPQISTVKRDGN